METKVYNLDYAKLHVIKTDLSKKCLMSIMYINKTSKDNNIQEKYVLELLTSSTKKYKTRRDLAIKLEDLYNANNMSYSLNLGKINQMNLDSSFISPKYINDDEYLKEVLTFPFEILYNPNVKNKKFNKKDLEIIKDSVKRRISKEIENPGYQLHFNALETMDENSLSSKKPFGTIQDVDKVTSKELYNSYKELIKTSEMHILIIGDINFNDIHNIFKEIEIDYKFTEIKKDFFIENKLKKVPIRKEKNMPFTQSGLAMIYNVNKPTKFEKEVVFNVLNHILSGAGLSSKLYKEVREKHSLCYYVGSSYMLFDGLFMITSSLDYNNIPKAEELITQELEKIKKGDFKVEDIKNSVSNLKKRLEGVDESNVKILSNYITSKVFGLVDAKEAMKLLDKVTKEDIIKAVNKLVLNTTFILKGDKNGEN